MYKQKEPQNWGALGFRPLAVAVGASLTLRHMCYPAEFDRSRSTGTSVIMKNLTIMYRQLELFRGRGGAACAWDDLK